jgi:hypothetical protein
MADRRYNDEEAAAIFLTAAAGPETPPVSGLAEIGRAGEPHRAAQPKAAQERRAQRDTEAAGPHFKSVCVGLVRRMEEEFPPRKGQASTSAPVFVERPREDQAQQRTLVTMPRHDGTELIDSLAQDEVAQSPQATHPSVETAVLAQRAHEVSCRAWERAIATQRPLRGAAAAGFGRRVR